MDQIVVVLSAAGGLVSALAGFCLALAKLTEARTRARKLGPPKENGDEK